MKINGWIIVGTAMVIFLFGAFISKIVGDNKLERLQIFSDSVAVVAQERDSIANKFSDSVKVVIAELDKTKRALTTATIVNRRVDLRLDSALVLASTAADSNNIRGQQVINLRQENVTLRGALAIANNQVEIANARGDSLLSMVNAANRDIIKLNAQVQSLHPRLPKLVRYSIEGVKLGVTFYAGVKYGQSHP